MLAAWREGALPATEAHRWEGHFAVCARCQEELAALVRTEPTPATAPPETSWWRLPVTRWITPLAAGATAVIALSVAIRFFPEADVVKVAEVERKEVHSGPAREERPAAPARAPQQERTARQAIAKPKAPDEARGKAVQPKKADEGALPAASREATVESFRSEPPPAAPMAAAPRVDTDLPVLREKRAMRAADESSDLHQRELAAGAMMAKSAAPRIVLSTPDGSVLWRIGAGGAIERSTDGGRGWEPQPSGVEEDLLGGACPSPSICWVVGRNGTVIRTSDGRTWERIDAPTREDLSGVTARDAATVTVRTAAGRELRTSDGGRSWQETKAAPEP